MKKVVIFPGRFQPMLKHHLETYSRLQAQFPNSDVYIATTDKVDGERSPFNFKEKQQIIQSLGIPANKVLQVRRPYFKDDYIQYFDESNTIVVFVIGEKDVDRFPFDNINPKTGLDMGKNGRNVPKYFQKINTYNTDPRPMSERGYIAVAPTIDSNGDTASSSAFRSSIISAPDVEAAKEVVEKHYGQYNEKIFNLLYQKIKGTVGVKESMYMPTLTALMDSFNRELDSAEGIDDRVIEDYKAHGDECSECGGDGCKTCDFTGYGELPSWDARKELDKNDRDKTMNKDIARLQQLAGITEANKKRRSNDKDAKKVEEGSCDICHDSGYELVRDPADGQKYKDVCTNCDAWKKGAGITEASVEFTAKPEGESKRTLSPAAAARAAARAKAKRNGPEAVSPKDQRDAASRPANALASNPSAATFLPPLPSDIEHSIANDFPDGLDVNDPVVKKEKFIKAIQKNPAILFGEINARLANDDNSLAVSDRLSEIVRKFDDGGNLNTLDQDEKTFVMKLAANALNNMELQRDTKGIDSEDDIEVSDEFDDTSTSDQDMGDDDYEDDEVEESTDDEECSQCHGCGIMGSGQDYDGSDIDFECTKCNGTGYADGRHREDSADAYYGDGVTEGATVSYEEFDAWISKLAGGISDRSTERGMYGDITDHDVATAYKSFQAGDFDEAAWDLLQSFADGDGDDSAGMEDEYNHLVDGMTELANSGMLGEAASCEKCGKANCPCPPNECTCTEEVCEGHDGEDTYEESFNLMKKMAGI